MVGEYETNSCDREFYFPTVRERLAAISSGLYWRGRRCNWTLTGFKQQVHNAVFSACILHRDSHQTQSDRRKFSHPSHGLVSGWLQMQGCNVTFGLWNIDNICYLLKRKKKYKREGVFYWHECSYKWIHLLGLKIYVLRHGFQWQ